MGAVATGTRQAASRLTASSMEQPPKPFKPHPLRYRDSCPDCGFVFPRETDPASKTKGFNCPRCLVHYSAQEYEQLNSEKEQVKRAH